MQKIFFLFAFSVVLASCGSQSNDTATNEETGKNKTQVQQNVEQQKSKLKKKTITDEDIFNGYKNAKIKGLKMYYGPEEDEYGGLYVAFEPADGKVKFTKLDIELTKIDDSYIHLETLKDFEDTYVKNDETVLLSSAGLLKKDD